MSRYVTFDFHALPITAKGCLDYLRSHGISDETLRAILVKLAPVEFLPKRRFEFSTVSEAKPAFVIVVHDRDGEPVDLVAWPIYEPDRWALLEGRAFALGEAVLANPATYFAGGALKAVRTPLGWLQAEGQALCVLRPKWAWWRLNCCPRIVAEDAQHARELRSLLRPPNPVTRVFVDREAQARAA